MVAPSLRPGPQHRLLPVRRATRVHVVQSRAAGDGGAHRTQTPARRVDYRVQLRGAGGRVDDDSRTSPHDVVIMNAKRPIEPLLWLLFSAGGVMAALFIPALLFLFGVA